MVGISRALATLTKCRLSHFEFSVHMMSEFVVATTETEDCDLWRIVERPLDIEVSCEYPNKQSQTNGGEAGGRGEECGVGSLSSTKCKIP